MMKLLGYVTNGSRVTERQAKLLTHINTAFAWLRADGTIEAGHLELGGQMAQLRRWNPKLKVLASVVPAPGEPHAFTVCAADPALRQRAAQSAAELVTRCGYDGVDFDWEYPCVPSNGMDSTPADKENFTYLCRAVRQSMDSLSPKGLFTIAAGADLYYTESVELSQVAPLLDHICLMTYDLKCGFHALAGHHTALYSSTGDIFRNSCHQALELFCRCGVPREKLLLGAAFYSRKWQGVEDRNHGLLQPCKTGGGYGPGYGELKENYIDKNGFVRYWDAQAKAPWLFDGSTFLSYDDEQSVGYKAGYAKEMGYGGIFYWEHGSDPAGTLLECIAGALEGINHDNRN